METLKYRLEKEVPVLADVDLLVVGMGPGGGPVKTRGQRGSPRVPSKNEESERT